MNRDVCDNALLAACDEMYGKVARVAGAVLVCAAIGAALYLVVALRA